MAKLNEKTLFERDQETTFDGKNLRLADLLQGAWANLAIVEIDRIEINDSGWLVTFRS